MACVRQPAAAAAEIVLQMPDVARGGDDARHSRVCGNEFEENLSPTRGIELGGPGRQRLAPHTPEQLAILERSIHEHGDSPLRRKRQEALLAVTGAGGIVALHEVQFLTADHAREILMRGHGVVCDADVAHAPFLLPLAKGRQLRLQIAQIVNLDQIETRRFQKLAGAPHLLDPRPLPVRPDLGREKGALVHCGRQQIAEHALGRGVHRRGIDETRPRGEERLQHFLEGRSLGRRLPDLERAGRAEADDRDLLAARGNLARQQRLAGACAGCPSRYRSSHQHVDSSGKDLTSVHGSSGTFCDWSNERGVGLHYARRAALDHARQSDGVGQHLLRIEARRADLGRQCPVSTADRRLCSIDTRGLRVSRAP